MSKIELFKVIIFASHFFFFGLAALFFLLKLHKKDKLKIVMFLAVALWIVFGSIDFLLELKSVLSIFP
ncbi:MAG: hypothetical protein WC152_00935 [Candidatus Izemoplasmatales bacterium]